MYPANRSESILIVDDTPTNLRLLSQILGERGYHLRAVTSGARALRSVEAHPPDLILLDIRMPAMNGYEVCRQLKANPRTHDIPIVFISALDEIEDKVKAFAVGGVDYITKPFQLEEVVARVETHLSLRMLQKNLQEANQRMQRELMLAAQVQSSIMRRNLPKLTGWKLSVKLIPAKLTCGDFFDAFRLPGGDVAILIADVVDKGVGAALYMAMSCALLRSHVMDHPADPGQVFQAVNHRILEDTATDQFVTVFFGILDAASGEMIYSNAGHNPPALVSPDHSKPAELLKHTGPPLGVLTDVSWEQKSVHLSPGDVLVLYTDGITEAQNTSGDYYGVDRLLDATRENVDSSAEDIQNAIVADLYQFVGQAAFLDDIALMVLARLPMG